MSIESRLTDVEESLRFLRDANRLQSRPVSAAAPAANQVLRWNGTTKKWEPAAGIATGTLANRPAPATAGLIYIPTDLPIMLEDDGTNWGIGSPADYLKVDWFHDDLVGGHVLNWDKATGSNGTVTDVTSAESVARLSSSATSGGFAVLRTAGVPRLDPSQIFLCHVRFKSEDPSAGNQQIQIGLTSGFPGSVGNPVDGLYVRKTDAGNFFAVVTSSSTEQETADLSDTGGAFTDIVIEGDGGTNVRFYLNGFKETASDTATLTTSLPTNNLILQFKIVNATTADRRLLADSGLTAMART